MPLLSASTLQPAPFSSAMYPANPTIPRQPATSNLPITHLPTRNGNIMPTFKHNLVGVSKFCDNGCKVLFKQDGVTIISKYDTIIFKGWHKQGRAKLWRLGCRPR